MGCYALMAMKKTTSNKTLKLSTQAIRQLTDSQLTQAVGGWIRPPITISCPQPH